MTYVTSMLHMPYSLKILCLTNLFCWMAHSCYTLYFTDFVGTVVFGGESDVRPYDNSTDIVPHPIGIVI